MCRLALAVALATAAASPVWAQSGTGQPSGLDGALSEIRQLRDQKQWLPALSLIEQTSAKYPDDDALYVLRVHTLSEIGARERAWQLYQAKPQLFSADEAQRIELDRLARLTSTSEYFVADETRRLEEARAVEAANQDYLKRAGIDASQMPLRMRYDRLDLLNRLERHREVVEEYEKLRAEGHDIPSYAMIPIGASLMDQKRPKEAIPVLEKAIEAIPDDNPKKVQYKIMHAYALMEAERFDLAQPELKALVEANPDWRTVPGAPLPYENWDRYHAEVNEAMVRSYAGDLAGSQKTLETMSVYGPDDSGVQSSLGSIYDRRGWHERALERHRMASTLDPQSIDARVGQVESLLELQRVEQARPIYNELQTVYPDTLQSRTLRDRWNQNVGWQWRAFAAWGRSDSDGSSNVSPVGSRDGVYGIEAETPLLGDRWRLTAGYADRYADFNDRRIHDRRGAFGVRYTYDRLDVHLQANRSHDDLDNTGASLDVGWRFSDVFDAGLALRKYDPEASLQARAFGITADSAALSANWHPSELTTVQASAQAYRFDDGNRRQSLGVNLDQRLVTRPHFLLNGLASIYTSRGTRDDAPYFNPSRDASMEFGVRADQVVWREYERYFRHRLTVTVAPYWQEDYGTAWVPSLRYEHEWQFATGQVLVYGVNWSRPVYDGQRERHLGFDAEFRWGK